MNKVKARVLRDFRVFVQPEGGGKEAKRRFRAGEEIECTPEQFEVGQGAGLLSDQPPEGERRSPEAAHQEE